MRLLGDLRVISSFLNSFSILRAAQGAKYHYIPLWCVLMRAIHCYTYYASHPMNFSHQAGLQQTMFIPRESVSTSPSKTGSPGKAKPISSCQGIHCCINWYQQISTARNCPIISIKNHQELLNLRVVWCVWSFHVTRPSHFNIYKYILTLSYLEARVYCSTLYQSPGKRSLAMEMAVPSRITCDHDLGWHHQQSRLARMSRKHGDKPQWLILWLCDPSLSLSASILQMSRSIMVRISHTYLVCKWYRLPTRINKIFICYLEWYNLLSGPELDYLWN